MKKNFSPSKSLISAYTELTKPRILTLVLVTTALGFFLGARGVYSLPLFFFTMVGAALVCSGASALNQYLECETDKLMFRTRNRPIPSGVISPDAALSFGITLLLSGVILLCWKVNLLTAFLSLLTAFLYVLVYTPMKRMTWLNTTFGAIPGAIPPMGGWAAAAGQLDLGAWALFLILFVWQHPHFYAIAWMAKDDYARAGFKMLPVIEPDGKSTFWQIVLFSIALIPVSMLPTIIGMSGKLYFYGAALLSIGILVLGITLFNSKSNLDAKKLLKATVLYLPLVLFLIVIDVGF